MIVLFLLLNLPFISALEITNVQATNITDTSAAISWTTDQAANTLISYGSNGSLQAVGDAAAVTNHQFTLTGLAPTTAYQYKVQSGDVVSDNGGSYSFTTLAPDTTPPILTVELPSIVAGSQTAVQGTSEAGAQINLYVNNAIQGSALASADGIFTFPSVFLLENQMNNVTLQALDQAHNTQLFSQLVLSDTRRPTIILLPAPPLLEERAVSLKGSISEPAQIEIFVNNRSQEKAQGTNFTASVNLDEGNNTITVIATDQASWQSSATLYVYSDTQPPQVTFDLEKGTEYYEGRAKSDLHGKTEPGATVFLYIYRPLGYEYKPDFKKARASTTAEQTGEFTFHNVELSGSIFDLSLNDLAPRQVPDGLLQYTIFPTQEVAQQQEFGYHIFVIAEDKVGKTNYAEKTVSVHTCYSQNLDFSVESIPRFQTPYRLVPQLLDDGRQDIQAVFQFNYLGQAGAAKSGTVNTEPAAKITNVRFEPACTRTMLEDNKFGLGCKVLPPKEKTQVPNIDGTSVYAQWHLRAAQDTSKRESDFWDDFKKRQVIFPLKITLQYQERKPDNTYGPTKTQTACYDIGYFVDIPLESKEMIPDFLANEGIQSLDWTLKQIQTIRPYLEKAFIVTAIGCTGSFLLKTAARWARIWATNVEHYTSWLKLPKADQDKSNGCKDPNDYYLQSEIDHWTKLKNQGVADSKLPDSFIKNLNGNSLKSVTLDERCPKSAAAWKIEAALDTAQKWTCDRSFCRTVPAAWTAEQTEDQINSVITKQNQCAVTGRGIPLIKRENCQKLVEVNKLRVDEAVIKDNSNNNLGDCWETADGTLYYLPGKAKSDNEESLRQYGVYYLERVADVIGKFEPSAPRLVVYKPQGADTFIVGQDKKCKDVCYNPQRKAGYSQDTERGVESTGCYNEKIDPQSGQSVLLDKNGQRLGEQELSSKQVPTRYAAGYTQDCFIKMQKNNDGLQEIIPDAQNNPQFQQCVCKGQQENTQKYAARTAINKGPVSSGSTTVVQEDWFYHQDQIFRESGKQRGTYYPAVQYFSGRDFSGAFGQDYLLDLGKKNQEKEVPNINPHTQFIGMFQAACMGPILKNTRMLESILTGLRNCLQEAKYTGLQDAGMCKTLFTQQVCGLFYKAMAYAFKGCSPSTFDDVGTGRQFGDVGVIVSEGFKSLPAAMESSIKDFKEDYGNAQLNEYFKGGAQGFAQSLCMAAFGYEFPLLSKEFLLDAAYATPMKTVPVIAPKERELSTYNPAKQTAIYNYNVGGVILPGCRIRNWKLSLKCIGPEDLGYPGVDQSCGGEGCDCLNAQTNSAFEGEKTYTLATGNELPSGQMFSIPLQSPIPVDSHYRYDHVLLELALDPSEQGNENQCFDQGYYSNGKGIFYESIKDVSQFKELSCRADVLTGRYVCPELATLFGFGGAYFEPPYAQCWNKNTNDWTDCTSPNLFVLGDRSIGDDIKVQLHLSIDEKGKCLKRTLPQILPGVDQQTIRSLPENTPGPLQLEDNLGKVRPELFGSGVNTILSASSSNSACGPLTIINSPASVVNTAQPFTFSYEPATAGMVKVRLPNIPGATIEEVGYKIDNGYLMKESNSQIEFKAADVQNIKFNLGGFSVSNVMGSVKPEDTNKQCTYQVISANAGTQANQRDILVTYELLERDSGGTCNFATIPAKDSPGGKAKITQKIVIQRAETALAQTGGLHENFMKQNYENVYLIAEEVLKQQHNDLTNALAIYYEIAAIIMKADGIKSDYLPQIQGLLQMFFERKYNGQLLEKYPAEVEGSTEFQKMNRYLCEIATKAGYSIPTNAAYTCTP